MTDQREEKRTGIPFLLAFLIFALCAFVSAGLLQRTIKGVAAGKEAAEELAEASEEEIALLNETAETVQDLILVELQEDGTTEKYVRLEKDADGQYVTNPGMLLPEAFQDTLCSLVKDKANGNTFVPRIIRVTSEGTLYDARSKGEAVTAEITMDENAPGYPFSVRLTKEGKAYSVLINFQSAALSYENAIETEDIYWYESRVTRVKG